MSILEFKKVKKEYRLGETTVRALRGVDLTVEKGEFIAVLGASGSGKTTLLNLAGAIDEPSEGEVRVNGQAISGMADNAKAELRSRTIGYIFQNFNLVSVLTALENVMLSLQIRGGRTADIRQEAAQRLDDVGLADFMRHRPDKLSGGQRQRVAIARALVTNPLLVLADEPTANLDHETAQSIIDLMKELNEKEGVTFLFSTHDQRLINEVKRVVRIDDGKIVQ
ncbi:MAG: ABC transporter ATP-binding protein [Nitrospirae bacterium]|nr:ABC transporter ATP-binding protein [Nitrospirota bacterium]NTW65960.1 ABC transporter ATP-binding protein [Nitrospirota bacterium]